MKSPSDVALPTSVLVTGLVRNCARGIRTDVETVAQAAQGLGRLRWLLIESDSTDRSAQELTRLAAERPDFRFISLGDLRTTKPLRTDRLAACRNTYLAELQENPLYQDVEYVVMADFDSINTLLSRVAMRSCWERGDWDVCAANQAGPYYDIWALRHPDWSPNDCWATFHFLRRYGADPEHALEAAVHNRMITISPEASWIEVDSAFGGLAVYRRTALQGLRYVGLDADGNEICEHVTLHRQMRARGSRIFINPQLINAGFTEHTVHMRLGRKLMRAAKRPLAWVYRTVRDIVPRGSAPG